MIPYTEEDFMVLFGGHNRDLDSVFNSYNFDDIHTYMNPVALRLPSGKTIRALWPTLRRIILNYGRPESDQSKHWNTEDMSLVYFIHEVPFNRVPLLIHDYPELAKWRLKVGK